MTSKSPASGKLTYEDYAAIPGDGRRHEIVDGVHIVNPAPSTYHQAISSRLLYEFFQQVQLSRQGHVFHAPTDLLLTPHDIVQPDLIVVLEAHRHIITPTNIKGTPDLVVEILSRATRELDRTQKKSLYEHCGVPEYWIVDPDEHHVERFVLQDGAYQAPSRHENSIEAATIAHVRIDLSKVWAHD